MNLIAFAVQLSFFIFLGLISAGMVWLMIRVGKLDVPGPRSSHIQPTPTGGGIGIVVVFLVGTGLAFRFTAVGRFLDVYSYGVIFAATAIAIIASLDDMFYLPTLLKLIAQLAAAALAIADGLRLNELQMPFVGTVELGIFSVPFTVSLMLIVTNAINFIDGLNGLASGVSAISCLFIAFISVKSGGWFIYFLSLVLAAGLLGFLPFNFPHARIFMGDVGSQFCGFVLAVLTVAVGRLEAMQLSFTFVPMLLFGVLFDVTFTLLRRLRAGQRLTQPHRAHIYQVAHRSGIGAVVITLLHWGFAAWGGICCIGCIAAPLPWKPVWVLLVIPPQCGWLAFVIARAKGAGITNW